MNNITLRHFRAALSGAVLSLLAVASVPAVAELPVAKSPQALGVSPERLQRIDAALQGYVDRGELPGGVLLVARDGQVVYSNAFGSRDIEAGAAMEEDAIFRIASQTKAITSVSIMMLQEQGKLLITDPVGKYIPEFNETFVAEPNENAENGYVVVKAKRKITLRDLLTHTSGIGYGGGPAAKEWEDAGFTGWYFAHRDEPIAATVERMAKLPNEAQPGTRFVYGYSTDILGVVIERASGMPLDVFMRTQIFEPLGMVDTQFYLPESKRDRLAVVYARSLKDGLTRQPVEGMRASQGQYIDGPRKSFSGGAGLTATAQDYATFLQMLLNGGEFNGARLLSPNTVKLMTTNQMKHDIGRTRPGAGLGLGFSVLNDLGARGEPGSVGEYSWGGAYHSSYWVDPVEKLVVVYLTQVLPAEGLDDHAYLRPLVYQAIVESYDRAD